VKTVTVKAERAGGKLRVSTTLMADKKFTVSLAGSDTAHEMGAEGVEIECRVL
jgi:hypothetical protein